MARCQSCSAPLPANSNRCVYCQVRNDVDLHHKYNFSSTEKESTRICPGCQTNLTTINVGIKEPLYIERCSSCFGLFFDPGEIDDFIKQSVSGVFNINQEHLNNINKDRYQKNKKITYKRCPECQEFMQRKNFGQRSGIVVDRCRNHGVWLESGEITHLMEWHKAGGQLLDDKVKQQKENEKRRRKTTKNSYTLTSDQFRNEQRKDLLDMDLGELIGQFIGKLF
ncbi:MAG: zf-TFIIB domain-containing protein [Gammaproteobacteria bacterium]|nr:zf-TFIIB domain-containing protein [Gammaproteobacteria bacterium]